MELDGFIDDTFSEYRERSVIRTTVGGSVSLTAPSCGLRYVGFVILDSLTPELVELFIDGVKQSAAVVDGNNMRERLFALTEPYNFQGGEAVQLRTADEKIESAVLGESVPGDLGIEGRARQVQLGWQAWGVELGGLEPPTSSMPLKRSPR